MAESSEKSHPQTPQDDEPPAGRKATDGATADTEAEGAAASGGTGGPVDSAAAPPGRRIFLQIDRVAPFPYSLGEYLRRAVWMLVQATLMRFSLPRVRGWRRLLLRCMGAQMAPGSGLWGSARIVHPWLLKMGRHATLGPKVTVYNLGPVSIGDHTVISQDVYICAGTHDYTRPHFPLIRAPVTIGSGVWIAAGAFIGPGVSVGDNAVVGARAVVMKDVPPAVVVAGNPARIIKPRPMQEPPEEREVHPSE